MHKPDYHLTANEVPGTCPLNTKKTPVINWGLRHNSAPCYFPLKGVSSPLSGLTAVFGMGTGVALTP